ncbi:MAG: NusG domain II-containing protein [Lachnospiraceae bacterium]|nr:NusG domain II-containing protein [Lachnospiraceae bacterium]
MKKKISIMELFIWIGVLAVAFILVYMNMSKDGKYVQIRVDGKVIATYSLDRNGTYPIVGSGKNVLVIEKGEAHIEEADCPDKLCIKQGKVRKVGQSLICLPNKVVVEVISEYESEDEEADTDEKVDAVVK